MGRRKDRPPDSATPASNSGNGGEPVGGHPRRATTVEGHSSHERPAAVRTDGGDGASAEAGGGATGEPGGGVATEQDDGATAEAGVKATAEQGDKATAEAGDGATAEQADVPAGSAQTGKPARISTPDRFDWRGWLVVVVVFVSFLVIPGVVLYLPDAHWVLTAIGLSRRQAYVVFPMVPAIVLGVTAVWAAVRAHSRAR